MTAGSRSPQRSGRCRVRTLRAAPRPPSAPASCAVDLVLPASRLDWSLAAQLDRLRPYGPGNAEPVLAVTGMRVASARRVGASEAHIGFRMRRGLETFDAVAFGTPAERSLPAEGDALDLVGTLERDTLPGDRAIEAAGHRLRPFRGEPAAGETVAAVARRPGAGGRGLVDAADLRGRSTARPAARENSRAWGRRCASGSIRTPPRCRMDFPADVEGIERFARGIIEAASEHAVAVKINVAFFEAFGSRGVAALERVRADVPADLFVILDAKRGDIGPTAERYAAALFGHLQADAVTLSPYLGEDAIEPFLALRGPRRLRPRANEQPERRQRSRT